MHKKKLITKTISFRQQYLNHKKLVLKKKNTKMYT